MNHVHRRTQILDGEVSVESITPWGALTADQQTQCRTSALSVIAALRTKDDASADSILDGWLAERRVNANVTGAAVRPTLFLLAPIVAVAPEPDPLDLERWLACEPHHFRFDVGARLLLRDNPEREAVRRQRLLSDRNLEAARRAQADERAFVAEQRREAELERRKLLWQNCDPAVRALLRGHDDPAMDAVFQALAAAYLKEPRRVDEQPPSRARFAMVIKSFPGIDNKKE